MSYWFVDCDIDGQGKKWRLATRVNSDDGDLFEFIESGFSDTVEIFDRSGCRYVGPFTKLDLLSFVEIAENVARFSMLPQKFPGEARVDAAVANAMITASVCARKHMNYKKYNW